MHTDIIVIGGGPAGMFAAGRAAELGAKVLLIEKTYRMGSKLLMTGGGRCNITNTAEINEFVEAFGAQSNGRFLYRALNSFSPNELISFFEARGLAMRRDPDGKVFPVTDRAADVLAVVREYLKEGSVFIRHNTTVEKILLSPDQKAVAGVVLTGGDEVLAQKVIIATGGLSYPATGSTGDGYTLARQCGHTIIPLTPALVPLESDEPL